MFRGRSRFRRLFRGRSRSRGRFRRLFRGRGRFRRLFRSRSRFRRLFRSRSRFRRLFRGRSRFRRLFRSRGRFRRGFRGRGRRLLFLRGFRGGLLRLSRGLRLFLRFFLLAAQRFGALGGDFGRGGFLFALNFKFAFGKILRRLVRNLLQLRRQLRDERLRRSTLADNPRVKLIRIPAAVRVRLRAATNHRVRTVGDQTLSERMINRRRFDFRLNNKGRATVLIRQIPETRNDEIGRARNAQRNIAQFVENDDALTVAPSARVH